MKTEVKEKKALGLKLNDILRLAHKIESRSVDRGYRHTVTFREGGTLRFDISVNSASMIPGLTVWARHPGMPEGNSGHIIASCEHAWSKEELDNMQWFFARLASKRTDQDFDKHDSERQKLFAAFSAVCDYAEAK